MPTNRTITIKTGRGEQNTLRARSALKLLRRLGLLTPPRCGSLSPLETIAFPLHSAKIIYEERQRQAGSTDLERELVETKGLAEKRKHKRQKKQNKK
jgi:hypothetical protein